MTELNIGIETAALNMQMSLEHIKTGSGKTFRVPLVANLERNVSTATDAAASLLEEFLRDEKNGAPKPRRKDKK